jgi:hypothetical protein
MRLQMKGKGLILTDLFVVEVKEVGLVLGRG